MDRDWELEAACRSEDPEIWFSGGKRSLAKHICLNACPVREECLAAVLEREADVAETYRRGITAGLTGRQRYALTQAQKPDVKPQKRPKPTGRPRSAPCGTRSAYQRHLRNKEPIDDACRDANSASRRAWAATGSTQLRAAG